MQCIRDIELKFPIKDATSASLMLVKADCLHKAAIINEAEKRYVHLRAHTFLSLLTETSAPTSRRRVDDDQPLGIFEP
jgi:hypothetical protein